MATMIGTCNCESIVISVPASAFPNYSLLCHCECCRKAGGTTGTLNLAIPGKEITLVKGSPKMVKTKGLSGADMERNFCGDCGSPFYTFASGTKLGDDATTAYVKASVFPIGTIPAPAAELFCRNKESWEPTLPGVKAMQEQS